MSDKPQVEHFSPSNSIEKQLQLSAVYSVEEQKDVSHELFNDKPDFSRAAVTKYFATRLSTLLDLPLYHTDSKWYQVINPIPGLREMTASDVNFYCMGFFAWALDSMDFFCVSVAAPDIALTLGVSVTDITWGVTLVLMLRSVGAVIFGLASDYFGRKWSYIIILLCFIAVEIGTGFVQTYSQFLGVRALFGILMGSMYPVAMVTALEGQPTRARSVLSGLFLPGYSFGYILAMVFYRAFANTYKPGEGWRALFWFSAGLSVILIAWRLCFPESPDFIAMQEKKKQYNADIEKGKGLLKKFDYSVFTTLKTEWLMFTYLVLLYAGWNFTTHGSQDLYVTLLTKQFNVDLNQKTIIIVVSNLGGIIGGIIMGSLSELFGRRLTVIICMVWCGAWLYPSFFNADVNWWAYVFLTAGVMGSWGVGPIHLLELVNSTHRTLLAGLAYQLGNLVSSASATIEARLGERFPINGGINGAYDYGKVMCIFCGCVFAYMIICIFFGPERFHKELRLRDEIIGRDEESELGVETSGSESLQHRMSDKPQVEQFSPTNSIEKQPQTAEVYSVEKKRDVTHVLFNDKPDFSREAVSEYFGTRLSTLLDLPVYHTDRRWYEVINPIPGLKEMTASDWNFYAMGYFAWALDALDFFCVSVAVPDIAQTLGVSVTDVSWGVTLVLMLRSVGAIIFGIASDYLGRKWSYIIISFCFIAVEIGTGFVQTYSQFLGVRSLFGILMGSMYPVAMVTALEGQPTRARSVLSGIFLPGYSFGYILAMVFYRAFANTYKPGEGWRSLFWFSGGLSVLLIIWRLCFPESPDYVAMKEKKKQYNSEVEKGKGFLQKFDYSVFTTLKTEWLMFTYLVLLYAGWNFTTHGSQDLYVTLLTKQFHVGLNQKTIIIVVSNIGGIIGGTIMGSMSELFGRRLTVIICMIWCGAWLYPSFFNADVNWWAYVLLNAGVMGSWGVGPIHLLELVNSTHRTLLAGLAYQLGNLISSASITIEAKLGEKFPINGGLNGMYDYGKVMCIFSGGVFVYMMVCIFFGPERFHKELRLRDEIIGRDEESDLAVETSGSESSKRKA
ncbi:Carboxylic acid transporter protein [Spathaspora sp. JA1]|nr:Carboxylic acid transporter protein [Spathaspora sp. JA1]